MNGWTKERKQRQSQQIHQWQPWTQSTGPKTQEGKANAKHNAWKHGNRSEEVRHLQAILTKQAKMLREVLQRV